MPSQFLLGVETFCKPNENGIMGRYDSESLRIAKILFIWPAPLRTIKVEIASRYSYREETKGGFCMGGWFWRAHPRSGLWGSGNTGFCSLQEHPPKPPFWKPPFCQPPGGKTSKPRVLRSFWGEHHSLTLLSLFCWSKARRTTRATKLPLAPKSLLIHTFCFGQELRNK